MEAADLWRIFVYTVVGLPAVLFVLLYTSLLPRLRVTVEAVHMLLFTAVIGYIAIDFLIAIALNWWEFSLPRFLTVMLIASFFLWQRLYLLIKNGLLPRVRHHRKQKQKAMLPVD